MILIGKMLGYLELGYLIEYRFLFLNWVRFYVVVLMGLVEFVVGLFE